LDRGPRLAAVEVEQRVPTRSRRRSWGPGARSPLLSKFGLSMITVVFEDRVPVYFARSWYRRLARRAPDPGRLETSSGVATASARLPVLVEGEARRDGEEDAPRLTCAPAAVGERRSPRSTPGASRSSTTSSCARASSSAYGCRCTRSRGGTAKQRSFSAGSSSTAPSGSPCAGAGSPRCRGTCGGSCWRR